MKELPRYIFLCSVIPFALLCYAVYQYSMDIPYSDQWHLIPLIEKQQQGTLSLTDLFSQHNEHRILLPRILFLLLASMSGWNIHVEQGASIITAIGSMGILILAVYRMFHAAGQATPPWSAAILSLIIFSLTQWQNWLWGWQLTIFLSVLFTLIGFFLLTAKRLPWYRIAIAFVCGSAAMNSFGTGLLFFLIGIWLVWIRSDLRGRTRIYTLALWVIGSLLLYHVYFRNMQHPGGSPPLLLVADNLIACIAYISAYLGTPVGGFSLWGAIPAGILGMILFMFLFFRLRSHRHSTSFFLALGVFAGVSAGMTAISRGNFGPEQAMSSRYVTIAQSLWVANIFLLLFALKGEKHTASVRLQVSAAVLVCLLIIAIGITSLRSLTEFAKMHRFLKGARETLISGVLPYRLKRLYFDTVLVEQGTRVLKQYHLSLFRE